MDKENQSEFEHNFKNAFFVSVKSFKRTLPTIMGIILLISLANSLITKEMYSKIFRGTFFDPLIGAFVGSISAGSPVTSYIIGGELLQQGIGLIAITSFIVAWVTVGIIQLPAESIMLGKKFALVRNSISFIFAIIVALITITLLGGSL